MKIFALAVLFILFIYRIKNTPISLSKTIWETNVENSKKKVSETKMDSTEIVGGSFLLSFFLSLLLVIFYVALGSKINTTSFLVLSALKVFFVLWNFYISMQEFGNYATEDFSAFTFHRLENLLNVILDYIYYPYAIWMLLK